MSDKIRSIFDSIPVFTHLIYYSNWPSALNVRQVTCYFISLFA